MGAQYPGFPNRRDDLYDADELAEREPDDEERLEHLERLLSSPTWCATSGQRRHRLTGVPEVDRVRAEVEALREALGLEEQSEEQEAREAEYSAYDMAARAALARGEENGTDGKR